MAVLVGTPAELVPTTVADLRSYLRSVPGLVVSDVAREAMLSVLFPPMPLRRRPLWGVLATAAVGLLPRRIRLMYGLPWCPPVEPAVDAGMTGLFAAAQAGDQRLTAEAAGRSSPGRLSSASVRSVASTGNGSSRRAAGPPGFGRRQWTARSNRALTIRPAR